MVGGALEYLALILTTTVGTMWCAYAFSLLALVALPQALQGGLLPIIQWVSQTFIQLVMLSVIMAILGAIVLFKSLTIESPGGDLIGQPVQMRRCITEQVLDHHHPAEEMADGIFLRHADPAMQLDRVL